MNRGLLTFFCGKMGAGKTTKATELAEGINVVLLSEDEWLGSIYPNSINSIDDYLRFSNLLKPQIKKLVQSILLTGTNVVLDFPANTISQKNWFRDIFSEIDAPHNLVYIDVADEICLLQIEKRRIEQPDRAATDTVEMFTQMTKYFVARETEEGFNIIDVQKYA